jgi:DNA-binding LytR/AlgR family response regulator
MNKIKIGIVEDEMIIAETIVLALQKIGYECAGVTGKYKGAIKMCAETVPDLMLLDINLGAKKDGIDLALEIKERFNTPIIFLTANSDPATVNRAKAIKPLAFLVKPFSPHDLYTAIEIGWNNYYDNSIRELTTSPHIIVKVGTVYEKVVLDEIILLKNEQNYILLTLVSGRNLLVRSITEQMLKRLPAATFVKINRTYIVNCKYVTTIETKTISIANLKLNITKAVKEELLLKM